MHVGVEHVIHGTVLQADAQYERQRHGCLHGGCPMEQDVAEQRSTQQQAQCPPPDLGGILKQRSTKHATKERPTP